MNIYLDPRTYILFCNNNLRESQIKRMLNCVKSSLLQERHAKNIMNE